MHRRLNFKHGLLNSTTYRKLLIEQLNKKYPVDVTLIQLFVRISVEAMFMKVAGYLIVGCCKCSQGIVSVGLVTKRQLRSREREDVEVW